MNFQVLSNLLFATAKHFSKICLFLVTNSIEHCITISLNLVNKVNVNGLLCPHTINGCNSSQISFSDIVLSDKDVSSLKRIPN